RRIGHRDRRWKRFVRGRTGWIGKWGGGPERLVERFVDGHAGGLDQSRQPACVGWTVGWRPAPATGHRRPQQRLPSRPRGPPPGITPFITHLDNAHLSESPSQQASQAADVNQYTQVHTVMAEQMLDPTTQSITGTYGC